MGLRRLAPFVNGHPTPAASAHFKWSWTLATLTHNLRAICRGPRASGGAGAWSALGHFRPRWSLPASVSRSGVCLYVAGRSPDWGPLYGNAVSWGYRKLGPIGSLFGRVCSHAPREPKSWLGSGFGLRNEPSAARRLGIGLNKSDTVRADPQMASAFPSPGHCRTTSR